MSQIDVSSVLSQIRALSDRIGGAAAPAPADSSQGASFVDSLKSVVDGVNRRQLEAQKAAQDFELGRTDIASAVLALQTAQVSFKAMTEARNRVVRAYQDVMNMPI